MALEHCGATRKRGGRCARPAGWGTDHVGAGHCKNHGGCTPNGELYGAGILAKRELAVMGRPIDIEPAEAILECIRITAGTILYASERIAELDAADAVGPVRTTKRRPLKGEYGQETHGDDVEEVAYEAPAAHIWIVMRDSAMDRIVSYSAVALRLGIEERRIKLAEDQGQLLADVIRGVLADLGVANHPDAPVVVRRHLSLAAANGTLAA